MKNKFIFIFLAVILSSVNVFSKVQSNLTNYYITDVVNPNINLNGIWKVNVNPPERFWLIQKFDKDWIDVKVPGELMMQGIPIKHDIPFVYCKVINIPSDYKGKTIQLQFDGVYSYARVWVNGNYICNHSGGFTRWECDITKYVQAGTSALLMVEVTDKSDEISYGSGYAKHLIGGILRDVNLLALPDNYPTNVSIKTLMDENYKNATLIVSGKIKKISTNSEISIELFDMNKKKVPLAYNLILINNTQTFEIVNKIITPLLWDAEHPNLYNLKISFTKDKKKIWVKTFNVGFREVKVERNKFLVNGKEVKLRGACRHDIHPLLGRVSTPEYELKDVLLAKEANINFIRTSHYPPTEKFLQLCDKYGIYVEDETAISFVGTHRSKEYSPSGTQNDLRYTERYLFQLKEMVNNHKNHPSVIMWSIGNESLFGSNFNKSYKWVKMNDDTRPVIFSYPGNVPDSIKAYDILSIHYPEIDGSKEQYGIAVKEFSNSKMPVIFDEWAHVACYNKSTLTKDQNVREFWGRSLDTMWQKTFDSDGGLGGAIWGMIDETFMLPKLLPKFTKNRVEPHSELTISERKTVGYGEWGIVDVWRRKKPEFWNTKKAYSPVKVLKTIFEKYQKNSNLIVPLYNRFDHTNINELVIKYSYKDSKNILVSPNIEPHCKGNLIIPIKKWEIDSKIILEFLNKKNELIDKYALRLTSKSNPENIKVATERIKIEDSEKLLTIICENNTKIVFDKTSGMISKIKNSKKSFDLIGPKINLKTKGKELAYSYNKINHYAKVWKLSSFKYNIENTKVGIDILGEYDNSYFIEYNIEIISNGRIKIKYKIKNIPQEIISEIGIKFELDNSCDSLMWDRNSYWSYYPTNHLATSKGKVSLYPEVLNKYRTKPVKEWNLDSKSFYYNDALDEESNKRFTYIAKSTKENIKTYTLLQEKFPLLTVLGRGNINCRISNTENRTILFINNIVDYVNLNWGNYQRNRIAPKDYSNEVSIGIGSL